MPPLANFPQEEVIQEEVDNGRDTGQVASEQISLTYAIYSYQFATYTCSQCSSCKPKELTQAMLG